MACFNDISIGVITDYEKVDLETRFQLWGMYLWLDTYHLYLRLLCERQGDENSLNLPISYHPYYTQQSFQVGKRKLDVCLSVGRKLTIRKIRQIKEQGNLFQEDVKLIAYGLKELSGSVTEGWLRKHEVKYDATEYDTVLATTKAVKTELCELREEETPLVLDPLLFVEAALFRHASEKQTLTTDPYCMLYLEGQESAVIKQTAEFAGRKQYRLLVNGKLAEAATECPKNTVFYPQEQLDVLYGVLNDAQYLVTDSQAMAKLAVTLGIPFTLFSNKKRPGGLEFVHRFQLTKSLEVLPKTKTEEDAMELERGTARRKIYRERKRNTYLFEDLFGMTQYVDCPTGIRKSACYGCLACKEICPKEAITMVPDEAGFLYPVVDEEKCIHCGLCERICIGKEHKQYARDNQKQTAKTQSLTEKAELQTKDTITTAEAKPAEDSKFPVAIIAYSKSKEQLESSSSGGIFQSLARETIENRKGVVVGVTFDENTHVVSTIAETMEEALAFSGSKYVKSDFAGLFPRVKQYLEAGRAVLYSGLPCECAGLKAYLQKDYENLTICELICHGGASPRVFDEYVKHIEKQLEAKLVRVNFRDKTKSWLQKDFRVTFEFENREPLSVRGRQNNYMNAFLSNHIFRENCYRCNYAGRNRVGDITIGDCHGVDQVAPEMYNIKGTSAVVLNTEKGEQLWNRVQEDFVSRQTTATKLYTKNHRRPSVKAWERARIFAKLGHVPINALLKKYNPWKES